MPVQARNKLLSCGIEELRLCIRRAISAYNTGYSEWGKLLPVSSIFLMDHPVKTLLYELFVEPVLRLLQRATMKGQFPWKAA